MKTFLCFDKVPILRGENRVTLFNDETFAKLFVAQKFKALCKTKALNYVYSMGFNKNSKNLKVLLENKFGNMKVPIEVTLSDVSQVNFQTVQVPGETIQSTRTMTLESGVQQNAGRSHVNFKYFPSSLLYFLLF